LKPRHVVIAIVIVLIIIIVASSFFVVDQTSEAVVLQFGRYDRTVGPGLHFKLPFGLETNYNVQTQRIKTMRFGYRQNSDRDYPEESIMLTGDLNIIDVQWNIQYRITDPQAWLFNVLNSVPPELRNNYLSDAPPDLREKTIRDVSQSVINRMVGDRALLNVLGSARERIQFDGRQRMNEIYSQYGLGIDVTQVQLGDIVPPAGRVQEAFEDVNAAEQDLSRFINEGRRRYNEEIPRARGQADRIIQEAEGYAARRVNQAQGDAARFSAVLEEYEQAPQITRSRLYVEMVENVFQQREGVRLIDRSLENLLPLMNFDAGSSPLSPGTSGQQQSQTQQQGGQ
jgi:membrane protease subunit HflK